MTPRIDPKVARFLFCGGAAAAVNWLARIALSSVAPFAMAVIIAYGIGMATGFALYRAVVWRDSGAPWRPQALRFLLVNAYGAAIVLAVSTGLVALAQIVHAGGPLVDALAHGLAIAIGAVANYSGHDRFTFRAPAPIAARGCET